MSRLITKSDRLAARYIPTHTMAVKRNGVDAIVYINMPTLTATAYVGTAARHTWCFRFRNQAQMEAKIKNLFDNLRANAEYKANRNAEQRRPHSLKVGDILSTCWGYEQTNREFFQVTKVVSDSMVELREVAQNTNYDSQYMSGTCTAIKDCFLDKAPTLRKRATADNRVRIDQSRGASLWDGSSLSYSTYG